MVNIRRALRGLVGIDHAYGYVSLQRPGDIANVLEDGVNNIFHMDAQYVTAGCSLAIDNPRETVKIFVAGVNTLGNSIRVAEGYALPDRVNNITGPNGFFLRDAETYYETMVRGRIIDGYKVEMYGHSAGGGTAEVMAAMIKMNHPDSSISIDTYGSPCPGYEAAALPPHLIDRQRWMNYGDPVPAIPWVNVGPLDHFWLLSLADARRQFGGPGLRPWLARQPERGYGIGLGTIRPQQGPYLGGGVQHTVQQWLDRQPIPMQKHSVQGYRLALAVTIARYGDTVDLTVGQLRPLPPSAPPINLVMPFELTRTDDVRLVVPINLSPVGIALDDAGGKVGTVTVEEVRRMFLRVNPKDQFRKVKIGAMWNVYLGNLVVLVSDEPRTPTTFVRAANRMLRAIGSNNTIFNGAFFTQLEALFLRMSSDPAVCSPLLRIEP